MRRYGVARAVTQMPVLPLYAGVLDLEELTTLMRDFLLKETKVQRPAKARHVPHRCDDEEH